ncbi:MAG: pyruvate dehydrogenase complex dihydrolipoamide acetyltransferase [Alphaproteobacteria bacterium]|nr:pyruvate dehydrogenase complex dihydrolipoamide acetyltransferase [Alphaproteobacteria bacterium]
MPIKILMPALSPTMTEGNLAKWLKKEGDEVAPGDVLAEIETDKATMEVEAVDEGILGRIVVPDGSEGVKVNAVIGVILEEGEDSSALENFAADTEPAEKAEKQQEEKKQEKKTPEPAAAKPARAAAEVSATPLARRIAEQGGVDIGTVAGTGGHGRITRSDVEKAMGGGRNGGAAAPAGKGGRIFASPLARRLAAENELDLASIAGSGPEGRIVKTDIEAALAAPAAAPAAGPAPQPAAGDEFDIVPLNTMRKVIAERMTHAKSTVPHFYLTVDCEIDELLKTRKVLNERGEKEGIKLSVNDFIIRACAAALMEVPKANVGWVGDGTMRQYKKADISVAVALEGGLITPIVRGAESKGLAQISADMKDLAARARDGKLAPEEYQGGSFSVSNLGMFGIKQFDAVINEPQACILAVGAGEQRPVVKDGELRIATVMTCTLSCDHRVVDGATGALLLSAIKRLIEYPAAMLL